MGYSRAIPFAQKYKYIYIYTQAGLSCTTSANNPCHLVTDSCFIISTAPQIARDLALLTLAIKAQT